MVLIVRCLICHKECKYSNGDASELVLHIEKEHPLIELGRTSRSRKLSEEVLRTQTKEALESFIRNSKVLHNLVDQDSQTVDVDFAPESMDESMQDNPVALKEKRDSKDTRKSSTASQRPSNRESKSARSPTEHPKRTSKQESLSESFKDPEVSIFESKRNSQRTRTPPDSPRSNSRDFRTPPDSPRRSVDVRPLPDFTRREPLDVRPLPDFTRKETVDVRPNSPRNKSRDVRTPPDSQRRSLDVRPKPDYPRRETVDVRTPESPKRKTRDITSLPDSPRRSLDVRPLPEFTKSPKTPEISSRKSMDVRTPEESFNKKWMSMDKTVIPDDSFARKSLENRTPLTPMPRESSPLTNDKHPLYNEDVEVEETQAYNSINKKNKLYRTSLQKWRPGGKCITCPNCGEHKQPIIRAHTERVAHSAIGASLIATCWPFCLAPCLFPEPLLEFIHCSVCDHYLGKYDHKQRLLSSNTSNK